MCEKTRERERERRYTNTTFGIFFLFLYNRGTHSSIHLLDLLTFDCLNVDILLDQTAHDWQYHRPGIHAQQEFLSKVAFAIKESEKVFESGTRDVVFH